MKKYLKLMKRLKYIQVEMIIDSQTCSDAGAKRLAGSAIPIGAQNPGKNRIHSSSCRHVCTYYIQPKKKNQLHNSSDPCTYDIKQIKPVIITES